LILFFIIFSDSFSVLSHCSGNQKESLFGAIDNTKTVRNNFYTQGQYDFLRELHFVTHFLLSQVVGGRLLRSNILRPTTDLVTINTRLDLVELFLR